jgi:hypothetical protein
LTLNEAWLDMAWIPIAGDGAGDYYMVGSAKSRQPEDLVFFVDVHEDPDAPTYLVGSDIWHFLVGPFSDELEERWWPFDRDRMLAFDPSLVSFAEAAPLPWEA